MPSTHPRLRLLALLPVAALVFAAIAAGAREGGPGEGKEGRRGEQKAQGPRGQEQSVFLTDVPDSAGSVILGRPTATSATLSLLWRAGAEAVVVWGTDPAKLPSEGRKVALGAGEPVRMLIDRLSPDTRYAYEVRDAATGRRLLPIVGVGSFHTARAKGSAFTFTVQADPHLDGSCVPALYERTLANVSADAPDFHIDLGDTFMTEKHSSRDSAARQYAAQRHYLSKVGATAPLFLVLGNHDGESLDRSGRETADSLAVWSHGMRTRYFANPVPDGFYSGNAERDPFVGPPENYYAWEWGDALFVALDPYRTSLPTKRGREPWNTTLGKTQYDWLAKTLRTSRARFKFVFIHQLTGSYHEAGRGGSEAALFQEWGGKEIDGRDTFAANRPGWEKPVHRLLVENDVTAVFHGHDHFYARQERDGVVYQLVPQPAHRNDRTHQAEEYGYKAGDFLPNSGHLRVKVEPNVATIDYVRSALPDGGGKGVVNGSVAARWSAAAR